MVCPLYFSARELYGAYYEAIIRPCMYYIFKERMVIMAKMTEEEKRDKKVAAFLDKLYPEKGYVLVVEDEEPIYRIPRKTDLVFIREITKKVDGIQAALVAERSEKD